MVTLTAAVEDDVLGVDGGGLWVVSGLIVEIVQCQRAQGKEKER